MPVFGISISEQPKIYFNHRNTLISLLSNTLIAKTRSKKIEMVHYQYLGNEHDVIARRLNFDYKVCYELYN
ncbi:hypothetical protein [Candidatus Arsenophonus triatominarum]|uniref:hypothetical protein n=1 Tax=Candidatus Arsenophonus triatominarum TaxID=57911 RepID=UPI001396846B|nr:hypothetical protein [Candidatus Arsenophonus triatominarum]